MTGTSGLTATGAAITLTQATNDFQGTVTATGTNIQLTDANALTTVLTDGGASTLVAGGALVTSGSTTGLLTTTTSGGAGSTTSFGATTAGSMNVTSTGAVSQTGTISTGAATFSAAGQAIDLTTNGAANDFIGAVSLTGATTSITDANALTLGTLATGNLTVNSTGLLNLGQGTVTGTLTANSGGSAISQTAGLTVTGTSGLTATGAAITLTQATNDFQGAVNLTGATTSITDANALTLGTLATGNLTVNSTGLLNLGQGTVTGTLTANSGGSAISQTAGLTVTGTSGLTATGAAITLTQATNDFQGTVTATGTNIQLTDANALTTVLTDGGASTLVAGGALVTSGSTTGLLTTTTSGGAGSTTSFGATTAGSMNVTSTGAVSQTGTISTGAATFSAAGQAIDLTSNGAANNFTGTVTATGTDIQLTDANALTAVLTDGGASTLVAGGALVTSGSTSGLLTTTTSGGAGSTTTFGTTTAGSMNVTSTGAISQTGVISTGAASFSAAGQPITLTQNNAVTGTVTLTGAATQFTNTVATTAVLATTGATTLTATGQTLDVSGSVTGASLTTSAGTTNLGTLNVGNNLTMTSSGNITQSGVLTLPGQLTLSVTSPLSDILLHTQANNLGSLAPLLSGTVANIRDLGLKNVNAGAKVPLIAPATTSLTGLTNLRNLTLDFPNAPIDLPGITASGNMTINAGGAITDSGASVVPGTTSLNANGNNITLDFPGNNFGTVNLAGANITLTNVSLVNLAGVQSSGAFTLTVPGTMTISSPVTGSTINLSSSGGDVILNSTVTASGDLTLAANSGSVTASAAGNISAGGAIAVTAAGGIQLASVSAGTVTITPGGAASFIGPLSSFGTFTVNAGGDVSFNSDITGGGTLTVNTAGVTSFNGAINGLGTLITDAPGSTAINGGQLGVTSSFRFNDPVLLGNGPLVISGPTGRFNRTVDGGAAVTVNSSGDMIFVGAIGAGTGGPLASFTTDAGGRTLFFGGSVLTTGAQSYSDAVLLGANTTFGASALTFNSSVNTGPLLSTFAPLTDGGFFSAASTGSDLTANVSGATVFNAAVGQNLPGIGGTLLGDVAISGGAGSSTAIHANFSASKLTVNNALTLDGAPAITIDTLNAQTYGGSVTLGTNLVFMSGLSQVFVPGGTDQGITFAQGLSAPGQTVDVRAAQSAVNFGGDVGSAGNPLTTLSVNGRYVLVGGDIWTQGDMKISIGTGTTGDNDFLQFVGTGAHNTRLDSASGEIILGSGATGDAAKTGAPGRASIFKSNDGDLDIFAHKITIQPFERLVVRNGSFVAIADGTAATDGITLSSTAATNLIILATSVTPNGTLAPGIHLRSRAPASIEAPSGTVQDQGTELVASAVYIFNTAGNAANPTPTRTAFAPAPATVNTYDYSTTHTGNILSRLGATVIDVLPDSGGTAHSVYIADLVVTNQYRPNPVVNLLYLDLSTAGLTTLNVSGFNFIQPTDSLFGLNLTPLRAITTVNAAPRTVLQSAFTPNVPREDATTAPPEIDLSAAVREQLQALGIYARGLRADERESQRRRRGLFTTIPERERPRESDYEVAEARVESRAVRDVLRLATDTGLIGEGQHKLDDVARALAASFEAFSVLSLSQEAKDFRAWLEASSDPDAVEVLQYVKKLHETLNRIELLGLTRQELASSKAQIYGSILRARLNAEPEFLRALVEGTPAPVRVSVQEAPAGRAGIVALR